MKRKREKRRRSQSGRKRVLAWFAGIFALLFGEAGLLLLFLLRVDTMTLWPVIPGARDHLELLQTTGAMVETLECFPIEGETETAGNLAAALSMVGASQLTIDASQSKNKEAEVITRYTIGLLRANLLRSQGDLGTFAYELLKIPFKTGSPRVMEAAQGWLYRVVNREEKRETNPDPMVEESGECDPQTEENAASKLFDYKKEHIYGFYYLPGNFHDYLEISGLPDGTDRIRFVFESKEENQMMEQNFCYEIGQASYQAEPGEKLRQDPVALTAEEAGYEWMEESVMLYTGGLSAEFQWEDENTIRLTKGGWHWEDVYRKPKEGDFIFPDSHRRKLTAAETAALSEAERRIAKNEIYARYGYPFDSPDLREYFEQFPWYDRGEYAPGEFSEQVFNEAELWNIELLK